MAREQRKQGRPKASEEPLTRQRILATALQLVNEQGVNNLTMRRLATTLNVDPMASITISRQVSSNCGDGRNCFWGI